MRGVITPAARGDILSHFRYYTFDQQVPESGARFLDTIESATEQISQNTAIGAPKASPASTAVDARAVDRSA